MVSGTIRIEGKHHSIPRCFEGVYYSLCELEGVECVGLGRYDKRGKKNSAGVRIKYYDKPTKTIKIEVKIEIFVKSFS